jgi:hypothetical protein
MKGLTWLFWTLVLLIYLYDQRFLAEKLQAGYFLSCILVRAGGLLAIGLIHQEVLWPWLAENKRWIAYGVWLLVALLLYTVLQNIWDVYLYGYVIGDFAHRNFWQGFPHTLFSGAWFIVLATSFHLSLEWFEQRQNLQRLQREIGDLQEQAVSLPPDKPVDREVFLKSGRQKIKVNLDNITHVQGLKDYSIVFTPFEKIIIKGSLKTIEDFFPAGIFLRVHKSYLVVREKISKVEAGHIVLPQARIPIGRSYRAHLDPLMKSNSSLQ